MPAHDLVTMPRAPPRAREPRPRETRARRPRTTSRTRVPTSNASGDGAQGLTTRQSYPYPVGSGDDTNVSTLARRRPLLSEHGGFREPGVKVKHPPPVQTAGGRQVITLVCHAARRLAGHTEETRARPATRSSFWRLRLLMLLRLASDCVTIMRPVSIALHINLTIRTAQATIDVRQRTVILRQRINLVLGINRYSTTRPASGVDRKVDLIACCISRIAIANNVRVVMGCRRRPGGTPSTCDTTWHLLIVKDQSNIQFLMACCRRPGGTPSTCNTQNPQTGQIGAYNIFKNIVRPIFGKSSFQFLMSCCRRPAGTPSTCNTLWHHLIVKDQSNFQVLRACCRRPGGTPSTCNTTWHHLIV